MLKQQDVIRLSKLMSVALRHDPAAFGLKLDENGWTTLESLVSAVAARPQWRWIQPQHVRQIVESSDKQRFELSGDLIRARYGHSRAARPTYQPVHPPEFLYHGTPRRSLAAIRAHGLKPMRRQYVHLSATPEMARQVGRRRDAQPSLLVIRAAEAHAAGVIFGTPSGGHDDVYLAVAVPPQFIDFPED